VITTYTAAPDIDVVTSNFPIPGFGVVPINAFVLHGSEPVLVDTGAASSGVGPSLAQTEHCSDFGCADYRSDWSSR
jgi:hypothetical protein